MSCKRHEKKRTVSKHVPQGEKRQQGNRRPSAPICRDLISRGSPMPPKQSQHFCAQRRHSHHMPTATCNQGSSQHEVSGNKRISANVSPAGTRMRSSGTANESGHLNIRHGARSLHSNCEGHRRLKNELKKSSIFMLLSPTNTDKSFPEAHTVFVICSCLGYKTRPDRR